MTDKRQTDETSLRPVSRSYVVDLRDWAVTHGWPVLVTGLLASAVVAMGFSTQPGLGDAPESVVGLQRWEVIHAPGYVLYTTLGHLFGLIVPVGSWALRANLFSAVVTVLAAVGVCQVARRMGASPLASIVAAGAWVSAASVWFYAGFAKHNALSAAWLVGILWVMSKAWRDPGPTRAGTAGLLMGLSVGLGWPPVLSAGAAVLWWLVQQGGPRLRRVLWAGAGLATGIGVVAGLVWWRTAAVPGGFGGVDSLSGLWRLWTLADFGTGSDPSRASSGGWGPIGEVARYGAVVGRDLGPVVVAVAVAGAVAAWGHADRAVRFLVVMAVGNLAAVVVVLDARVWGFRSGIVQGGFVAPIVLSLALLAAQGLDQVGDVVARYVDRRVACAGLAVALLVLWLQRFARFRRLGACPIGDLSRPGLWLVRGAGQRGGQGGGRSRCASAGALGAGG